MKIDKLAGECGETRKTQIQCPPYETVGRAGGKKLCMKNPAGGPGAAERIVRKKAHGDCNKVPNNSNFPFLGGGGGGPSAGQIQEPARLTTGKLKWK